VTPHHLIISCSLNPESKSRWLAATLHESMREQNASVELADLRDWPVPICDGNSAYEDAKVIDLAEKIRRADCVLLSVPIYNFDVSAAAKNMVELAGGGLEDKVVGFLCAAGGSVSYMSVMSFANSLMLDFRCFIIPRFVYATGPAFGPSGLKDPEVRRRIEELGREAIRITAALAPGRSPRDTAR
jgi:FMN reductase